LPGPVWEVKLLASASASIVFFQNLHGIWKVKSLDILLALNTPGNRLERLKGDCQGRYSIRINDQRRLCFEWPEDSPGPLNVEMVDYH